MIRLFTGLPGAGKTLSLVAELVRLKKVEPDRPVYVCGIDGLKDGYGIECDPREWESFPDGSIVVVDEAQKIWPSRGLKAVSPSVQALSEHRHRGFDFLLCTQSPGYLDSYIIGLVQEHVHVVRRWGGKRVDRYIWQEACKDVKSTSMRQRAQRTKWKYPKECFDLYKSASLHTVKRKIPFRVMMIPVLLLVAGFLGWFGMRRGALEDATGRTAGAVNTVQSADGMAGGRRGGRGWATPEDYVKAHIPRVANQPWSAPVYDDQAVQAHPDLLCIEYELPSEPGTMLCTCYTEQVTPYRIGSLAECRTYARHGVYNPRRSPVGAVASDSSTSGESSSSLSSPKSSAAVSSPVAGGSWSRSGSAIATPYHPPEATGSP